MARTRPGKTAKRNRQETVFTWLCIERNELEKTPEEFRSIQTKDALQRIKIDIANLKAKGLVE